MKIGVDASCWLNLRGYGRYTRELLGALLALDQQNQYRLFLSTAGAQQAKGLPESDRCEVIGVQMARSPTQAAEAAGRRSLRDLWAMTQAVNTYGNDLDLFFFPSVYTFFPLRNRAKVVVTIHDTIAERYPQLIFPSRWSRLFWNVKVRVAIWQSDVVATVSQAARQSIIKEFRLSDRSVRIIPDAVDGDFRPIDDAAEVGRALSRYGISPENRIILYVGGISPHKNLTTLVDAFASLVRAMNASDLRLVLVGDFKGDVFYSSYPALRKRVEQSGLAPQVIFTGFVSDADLPFFYNAAQVVVLPSFDEGFGLPALEAMACGTPVVASRAGALPDVVGDGGRLFDPHSVEDLKANLMELVGNPRLRAQLADQALGRAREFSWDRSATAALATFEELVQVGQR